MGATINYGQCRKFPTMHRCIQSNAPSGGTDLCGEIGALRKGEGPVLIVGWVVLLY